MVDVFARVFCMRAELLGTTADRQIWQEASSRSSKSGTATYLTSTRDNRRRNDVKYDRVGMFELQGDVISPVPRTSNGEATLGNNVGGMDANDEIVDVLSGQCTSLKWEVSEIRRLLTDMTERATAKEDLDKRAREWKVVALVLDRLFFFVYLLILIMSAFLLFETSAVHTEYNAKLK